MRYKHFRNANVDVSALAVGTWAIGGSGYGGRSMKRTQSPQSRLCLTAA